MPQDYGPGRPTPEARSRQIIEQILHRSREQQAGREPAQPYIPDLTRQTGLPGPTHGELQQDIQAGNVGHQQTGGFQPTPGAWPPQITPGTIPDFSGLNLPEGQRMQTMPQPGDPSGRGALMDPRQQEIIDQFEQSHPEGGGGVGWPVGMPGIPSVQPPRLSGRPEGSVTGVPEQPGFLDLGNTIRSALGGEAEGGGRPDLSDPEAVGAFLRNRGEQVWGATPMGIGQNLMEAGIPYAEGVLSGIMGWEQADADEEQPPPPRGDAGRNLTELQERFGGGSGAQAGPREGEFGTILAESPTSLPPSSDEVLPEGLPPTMDREVIEDYLEALADTGPGEFEEEEQRFGEMLGAMAQGMAGMGGDATVGQLLLGAGAGASQARQQHLDVERQRREQHDQIDRQHRQQMAQAGLEAEATLLESERQAYQDEMERGITAMEIDEARRIAAQPDFDFQNGMLITQSVQDGEDGPVQRIEVNASLLNNMMNAQSGAASRSAALGGGGGRDQLNEAVMVGTQELGQLRGLSDEARHVLSFSGALIGGTNILQSEDQQLYSALENRAAERIRQRMERLEENDLAMMDQDDIDDMIEAQMAKELAFHFSTPEGQRKFADLASRYGDQFVKMLAAPRGE